MKLKIGNSVSIVVSVVENGVAASDLSTLDNVVFMVKEAKTDLDANAVISKNMVDDSADFLIDDPETGKITIKLSHTDTSSNNRVRTGKTYYFAVQLVYPASTEELDLKVAGVADDTITFTQNIIKA